MRPNRRMLRKARQERQRLDVWTRRHAVRRGALFFVPVAGKWTEFIEGRRGYLIPTGFQAACLRSLLPLSEVR